MQIPRTCPACGLETLKFYPRQGVMRCTHEDCGESFPPESSDPASAPSPVRDMRGTGLSSLAPLVRSWPSVLALPLREFEAEQDPRLKLWCACDLVELILRFLVMIGVAEAAVDGELPEAQAKRIGRYIEHPMLGQWRAMAQDLLETGKQDSLVPEAQVYLSQVLRPLLDGEETPRTAESSFASLRNRLAHGAGVTRDSARRLLDLWQPRLEAALVQGAWLGELTLVVQNESGERGELRGPTVEPIPVHSVDSTLAASVLLMRNGRSLSLWPLTHYGLAQTADAGPAAPGAVPQVYTRRGEVRLEYTPLGSESVCEAIGDQASLEAFQRIFRLEQRHAETQEKGFTVRSFEVELRKDAEQLVGRAEEIETLQRTMAETQHGLIWIPGLAGVGKSYLMARLACDLIDDGVNFVLPFRFHGWDAERCQRTAFLRYATERLEARLGEKKVDQREGLEGAKPVDRLRHLLARTSATKRVVFVLDGLDELVPRDPDFVQEVVLVLRLPGVLWLCAGRSEAGLPEAFGKAGAIEPFPDGLPRMHEGDIRTLLLEKLGPLRKRLLKGDRDEDDRVVNPL